MSDAAAEDYLRASFAATLESHPEWPNDLVAIAWDAIDRHDYEGLDRVLAQLDRLSPTLLDALGDAPRA